MSKQSKKQAKRRQRQKKRRQQKLYNLFTALYPDAPDEVAEQVVALATSSPQRFSTSNTALLKEITLDFVRRTMTDYDRQLDHYIENVLSSLAEGQAYSGQTPQSLEEGPDQQALEIIKGWQWPG